MFKRSFILLILLSLSFGAVLAIGTDDRGNLNDPNENDRANACYDGGSMEGKCNTTDIDDDGVIEEWEITWHWECGWYLIRFEYGLIDRSDFHPACASLLPPIPGVEAATAADSSACYPSDYGSISYSGTPNTSGNLTAFESLDCSGAGFGFDSAYIVIAADSATADGLCGGSFRLASDDGFSTPSNYWLCFG